MRLALAALSLALVGCDQLRGDDERLRADLNAALYSNVRQNDAIDTLRADLERLRADNERLTTRVQRLTDQNIEDARTAEGIARAYNGHLDWHTRQGD